MGVREFWSHGYFETLKNEPLTTYDILHPNCFYNPASTLHEYVNEYMEPLDKKYEPCGFLGLNNIFGVQYEILKALGEPLEE